jgi:hypothetical protein
MDTQRPPRVRASHPHSHPHPHPRPHPAVRGHTAAQRCVPSPQLRVLPKVLVNEVTAPRLARTRPTASQLSINLQTMRAAWSPATAPRGRRSASAGIPVCLRMGMGGLMCNRRWRRHQCRCQCQMLMPSPRTKHLRLRTRIRTRIDRTRNEARIDQLQLLCACTFVIMAISIAKSISSSIQMNAHSRALESISISTSGYRLNHIC